MYNAYSKEELNAAWSTFAETRKMYQAEYHLLNQPYRHEEDVITLSLQNPIEETILNTIRSELAAFLRERLQNTRIQVRGEIVLQEETKRPIYTNREKFEYLMEKNPLLKEMKDRLGLDSDF